MYRSHYDIRERPFEISTDTRFLWMGEKHKEALAMLKYGVLARKGFLLLTGDVGTGKTTLVNALMESLNEDTLVANITDPLLEPRRTQPARTYCSSSMKPTGSQRTSWSSSGSFRTSSCPKRSSSTCSWLDKTSSIER